MLVFFNLQAPVESTRLSPQHDWRNTDPADLKRVQQTGVGSGCLQAVLESRHANSEAQGLRLKQARKKPSAHVHTELHSQAALN